MATQFQAPNFLLQQPTKTDALLNPISQTIQTLPELYDAYQQRRKQQKIEQAKLDLEHKKYTSQYGTGVDESITPGQVINAPPPAAGLEEQMFGAEISPPTLGQETQEQRMRRMGTEGFNAETSRLKAQQETPGKTLDSILAERVRNGEITLEEAVKLKGAGAGVQFVGTQDGQAVLLNPKTSDITTKALPGRGPLFAKNTTEGQTNAALFGERATQADQQLNDLISSGVDPASLKTGINKYLPNFMQSGNTQQLEQIKRNFVSAVLRKESGAAISPKEMSEADKQYFPQAGDKPEVLQQKQINRQTAIEGLNRASGGMGGSSAPSGVPSVGGTFQGAKVLKVKRIS